MKETIQQQINKLFFIYPCVMIEQKDGRVYLLKEHWRYLNWKRDAEQVLIGKGQISNQQYEYLTKVFFIRTKHKIK